MSDGSADDTPDRIATLVKRFEQFAQNHQRAQEEFVEWRKQQQEVQEQLVAGQKQLERRLEDLTIDLKIVRERDRAYFRQGPHQDPPRPPETQTRDPGHGGRPWERKPATPRVS